MPFIHQPRAIPSRIIIVGAGGTGGRLVNLLAQLLKTMPHVLNPTIYVIDADTVEHKNLARQNFIQQDVDQNKAEVLANRYGAARDISVVAIPLMVNRENMKAIMTITESGVPRPTVFISCVDNVEARKQMLHLSRHYWDVGGNPPLFVDSGNEDSYGQVMWFHPSYPTCTSGKNTVDRRTQELMANDCVTNNVPFLPFPWQFYSALRDTGNVSCADLDQTLAVNNLAAAYITSFLQMYYQMKPISSCGVKFSLTGGTEVLRLDAPTLAEWYPWNMDSEQRNYWDAVQPGQCELNLSAFLNECVKASTDRMAQMQALAAAAAAPAPAATEVPAAAQASEQPSPPALVPTTPAVPAAERPPLMPTPEGTPFPDAVEEEYVDEEPSEPEGEEENEF